MTVLAPGSSVTVAVRDGGTIAIATNGGFGSAVVSPTEGGSTPVSFGPAPERRVLGPYREGASVVLTNQTCGAFDYDAETTTDLSNVAITGGVIGGIPVITLTGADPTGASSSVSALQAAMSALSANGGGTLRIRSGTYLFAVNGDTDTIQIPSNVIVECEPNVIFKWGYWGSPLFAIVNKQNVRLRLNGAKFVWSGTFGTTVGARDAFGYGRAIPAYEWCAHIAVAGSNYVEIEDAACAGDTTANQLNNFLLFRGTNAGGLTEGNKVRRLLADDVCQGIIWGEQKRFVIDGVQSDRYSNASNALYGMGHVIYVIAGTTPSENGEIRNITDNAGTMLSAFTSGAHTLSLKSLKNTKVSGILSKRPEGALNFNALTNVDIDFHYFSDSSIDDTGNGVVFASDSTNSYVRVRGTIIQDVARNNCLVNLGAIASGSKNLYCEMDLKLVRTTNGAESNPAVQWVGNYGHCNVVHTNKGTAIKVAVNVVNTSTDNIFHVRGLGSNPAPRIGVSSGSRNTFYTRGDSTLDYDDTDFTPASGNAVIWEGARQYQSTRSLGAGVTNPTATFTLPRAGSYLVNLTLRTSDSNNARTALYWVVFDDASTSDYTTAQLIGAQISKGASAPTVLGLAVDQSGLCTMTSTAASGTWAMSYGYRQLTTA